MLDLNTRSYFTKIGFILSVAGGAVGLGNAWKFPTLTAQNGGFAFVLMYLFFTLTIGLAVFIAELALGKLSRSDLATAYEKLALSHKKTWKKAGIFMLGGIFVLSFYLMIMAWVLKYMVFSIFTLPSDITQAQQNFDNLISNELSISILFYIVSFFITIFIVSKGIIKGIEKLNIIVMPTLFIMLLLMLFFCFSFDGFSDAFLYIFKPDFSNFSFTSILESLGLAFFTLCLGVGCIVTYAASLNNKTNLIQSSLFIVLINIIISLMMGLIVFTFIFEFNADPTQQGPGLVFVSLMSLFSNFGLLGNFLAFYFFLALFFAGITSAVSMIEPLVFYFTSRHKLSRNKALSYIGIFVFILGLFCILSLNNQISKYFVIFNKDFFSILDFFASNIILPLGVFVSSIFVGFFVDIKKVYKLFRQFMSKKIFIIWLSSIRYLCPIMIIIIAYYQIFNSIK